LNQNWHIKTDVGLKDNQNAAIWKTITGNDMKTDHDKIIKSGSNKGKASDAMTINEYKNSDACRKSEETQQEFQEKIMRDSQSDDDNDSSGMHMHGGIPGMQGMHGIPGMRGARGGGAQECHQM